MPSSPPPEYRWNVMDFAVGYDQAAEHIHPHYRELQDRVLDLLPFGADADLLLVDAGGGSGRLVDRFLARFARASAIVVDQSEAFLSLATERLARFGGRAECWLARLQDRWTDALPRAPAAIVSMSAIHHLDPSEKQDLYRRCFGVLRRGGVFINADEVRPPDDADYLDRCRVWVAHMTRVMDAGLVPEPMCENLRRWADRNVANFGQPRRSGDDSTRRSTCSSATSPVPGFAQSIPRGIARCGRSCTP